MLDSIYHMTLKFLKNHIFGAKIQDFAIFFATLQWMRYQICKPLVVYQFYYMALYHSQMRHHVIRSYKD